MNIFLALGALFTFFLSLPFLLWNATDLLRTLVSKNKENDDLKLALEKARESGDEDSIGIAKTAYLKNLGGGYTTAIGACLVALVGVFGLFILAVSELIVIITTLALHIGIPMLGYIALVIWVLNFIYTIFIAPKQIAKKTEEAKAIGNTYIPETNYFFKGFFWLPNLYALYVVLVIIGLL